MADPTQAGRTGVWIFGALGSIATHVLAGTAAMRRGIAPRQGLITDLAPLTELPLPDLDALVFGGHELRPQLDPLEAAREIAGRRAGLTSELVEGVADDLRALASDIRPGCLSGLGDWASSLGVDPGDADPVSETRRMREDIEDFRDRHGLDRVVAVNLASTEPVPEALRADGGEDWDAFLEVHGHAVPASVLFTVAAFQAGCAVVNFTPSPALDLLPVRALADASGRPYCGRDGKTGETLLKSVLGPMFLARNLRVLSWESYNLLGNRDGQVLAHEDNKRSKLEGKSDLLRNVFDYPFHGEVHIDYVPSLDDWKTAWNLIHFEGFLGTRMMLQFTWQGCDSALAAPLVLDLARLADLALQRGESGPMLHTAAFFKAPLGDVPADLPRQMDLLRSYCSSA